MSGRRDVVLPALAEEELAFLEGDARGGRLVELPGVDALGNGAYLEAVSAGLRSLLDRGFVSTADEPTRAAELDADVQMIRDVRAFPALVVIVTRVHQDRRASRYAYGSEPGLVLLEEPGADCTHAFRLCAASVAAVHLAGFIDPDGRAREDGPVMRSPGEIERQIGVPGTVTRLFPVRRADADEPAEWEATVAASREGLWLVVEAGAHVAGRALSPQTCLLLLERLLDPDVA